MNASISDRNALIAVSPMALSAYARTAGWTKADAYGDHSDVYAGPSLPEIIIPRTRRLGDYAPVVARLISIFAQTAEISETTLYNDLVIADRDAVRARVSDGSADGSVDLNSGVSLVAGIRDALLATAYSLRNPRPPLPHRRQLGSQQPAAPNALGADGTRQLCRYPANPGHPAAAVGTPVARPGNRPCALGPASNPPAE